MFRKLLSRRFLLAVAALVLETLGIKVPPEVLGVVGAYVVGESAVDAAAAFRSGRTAP